MKEYDVFLPSCHPDGRPIEPDRLAAYKQLLVDRFGGLTHFPQENEGLWRLAGRTFRDRVTILRVLAGEHGEGEVRQFFREFRRRLAAELQQIEVLVIERDVTVLD